MAILRGEEGAVQFDDAFIAGTRRWTLKVTKKTLRTSRQGNTFRAFSGSAVSGSGVVDLIYNPDAANQPAFIESVIRTGDPANATFELFTSRTTNRLESLRFAGTVVKMRIVSAAGDLVTARCNFITSGEITTMHVVRNLITQGGDQLITQSGESFVGKVPVFL